MIKGSYFVKRKKNSFVKRKKTSFVKRKKELNRGNTGSGTSWVFLLLGFVLNIAIYW